MQLGGLDIYISDMASSLSSAALGLRKNFDFLVGLILEYSFFSHGLSAIWSLIKTGED